MRESILPLVVAVLCLLAIGFAAATVSDTADVGSIADPDVTEDDSVVEQEETEPQSEPDADTDGVDGDSLGPCVEPLHGERVELAMLGTLLALSLAVSIRWNWLYGATFGVITVGVGTLLLLGLTAGCPTEPASLEALQEIQDALDDQETDSDPEDDAGLPLSSTVFAALVLLVGVGAVVLYAARSGSEEAEENEPETDLQEAIGEAAGTAADRIASDAPADNEIHRAWVVMTDVLPVERSSTVTPAEFAEAAVAAGIEPDDVEELTELFRVVRYGDADVTPELEERAVAALQRIEDRYGTDDDDEGAGISDRSATGGEGGV